MANDTAVDQQQLQTTIDELYRRMTDLIKAQLSTINVGDAQALGVLSTADDLASAPVGDQATLLNAIGLGVLSGAINAADLATFRDAIGLGVAATGDAEAVRTAIGLGALATLGSVNNANWSGMDLSIANGGTGASDAAEALTNLGAQSDLGFTPVQQGGGTSQTASKVYLGWSGTAVRVQADTADQGEIWTDSNGSTKVASATAAFSVGSIGSYMFLKNIAASDMVAGQARNGSFLQYSSTYNAGGNSPSGTWMAMGLCPSNQTTLFLRIN